VSARRLPLLARLLLALLRGGDADIVRGDIEERYRRRPPGARRAARQALLADVARTLLAWWHPGAVRRRARRGRAASWARPTPLRTLWADLRLTVRGLARRPAFTAVVVLTLGFGIGATTTIYSVVDAVVVRPLPYADADRLVMVGNTFPGREWQEGNDQLQRLNGVSLLNFLDWRARARSFAQLAAVEHTTALLPDRGEGPELAYMAVVTDGFFSLLGVPPALGRTFLPDDFAGRNGTVVMLSYGAWIDRFGGDPGIVDRTVTTLGSTYTVVGVLPRDFTPPEVLGTQNLEFWVPVDAAHPRYASRGRRSLYVLGRLADGATVTGARAELDAIQAALAQEYPDGNVLSNGERLGAGVNALHDETVGGSGRLLVIFLGASALLLLIAALNAANLLLVRGLDRQAEMGVRRALGAGRARLTGLLLIEGVVLAAAGGAVGVVLALGGVEAFLRLAPSTLPRLADVAVNPRILGVTGLVSLGTGLLVGLLPALRLTGHDMASVLREGMATTAGGAGIRLRTALVAGQLSLALVLGVGASLLFNSFIRVATVDPGFQPDHLSSFWLPLKRPNAVPGETSAQAWDALLAEISTVPGTEGVAVASNLPFQPPHWAPSVVLQGDPPDYRRTGVAGYIVTPNYFDVVGIPVVAGRSLTPADRSGTAAVAVVNEEFARAHLGGRNPIGTPIRFREGDAYTEVEIVGVVGNVVQTRAEEGWQPAVYVPYTQMDWTFVLVAVRSDRDPDGLLPDLRRAAARFSPAVPITNLGDMRSRIRSVQTEPRFRAILIGSFALVAVLLAAIGLYGSLAYAVTRRSRELGIRMALGADPVGIVRLVLGQGLAVTAAGLALGLAGAAALSRLLRRLLFEVGTLDLASFAVAVLVLAAAALLAIVVPARRATAVDVVRSLRVE
jgi:putative ABC transport system permease protein